MPHTMQQHWLRRNDRGLELERQGKTSDAIGIYETNLSEGCDATFTFNRLARLYRARGDVENEARVLEAALRLAGSAGGRYAAVERRLVEIHALRRRARLQRALGVAGAVLLFVVLLLLLLW